MKFIHYFIKSDDAERAGSVQAHPSISCLGASLSQLLTGTAGDIGKEKSTGCELPYRPSYCFRSSRSKGVSGKLVLSDSSHFSETVIESTLAFQCFKQVLKEALGIKYRIRVTAMNSVLPL